MEIEEEMEDGPPAPPLPEASAAELGPPADFSRREFALRELLDGPSTYAEYRAAVLDLARTNRLTRGYRPTLEFLDRAVERVGVGQEPLHVVDVGCGHGDVLRAVHRWAAKHSVPLRLTGIDINPYAARLARECDRKEFVAAGAITWVTGNVFNMKLEHRPDVVISSLFTHHLSDKDIVRFLRWCEEHARIGWFVNDLERAESPSKLFPWMAFLLRCHPVIAHDGPISFRRALSREDWQHLVGEAGIPEEQVRVCPVRPARLCLERFRGADSEGASS